MKKRTKRLIKIVNFAAIIIIMSAVFFYMFKNQEPNLSTQIIALSASFLMIHIISNLVEPILFKEFKRYDFIKSSLIVLFLIIGYIGIILIDDMTTIMGYSYLLIIVIYSLIGLLGIIWITLKDI